MTACGPAPCASGAAITAALTRQLAESRDEAMQRLVETARDMGASAVIAMRFDSDEIGEGYQEIVAYGTAVRVRKP